jgi:dihydropteroate synthase
MQPRALDQWKEDRPAAALLFSEAAQALGARSEARGSELLALSFFSRGLPTEARQALSGHAELSLTRAAQLPGRECLSGSRSALQQLAPQTGPLAQLLAAHGAAARPPRPPLVMGILNQTPDSFSDGGRQSSQALDHALDMLAAGAAIIDVGGESTRPGSKPVSAEEEIRRTEPLIRALAKLSDAPISIDTTKASVARAALDAGASMVNDISAGRFDAGMLDLVAERAVDFVLMHIQKTPLDMQHSPEYADPVSTVIEHLRERVNAGLKAGIAVRRMAIDPGIGFGKRLNDNILLMRSISEMRSLGLPVLVGTSRKSMLASISGQADPSLRDPETLAAQCFAQSQGAEIHRVHAVQECVAALKISAALGGLGLSMESTH